MGNKLIGCDICQKACPYNRNAPELMPSTPDAFLYGRLLCPDGEALNEIAQAIGKNYARDELILAQAAIVAGNSGNAELLPLLAALDRHQNITIREHAEWARNTLRKETGETDARRNLPYGSV